MKVKDLKPTKYNPRKISEEKLQMLGRSMDEFGDLSGIVFNRKIGSLICGHQRIKHIDGETEIIKKPHKDKYGTIAVGYIKTRKGDFLYREVEWSRKKHDLAMIASNKHGGEFIDRETREIISRYDTGDIDLTITGYQEKEIAKMMTEVKEVKPEVEFTEELFEEHNFIVLYFDNKIDWLNLLSLYPLKTVKSLDSKEGFERQGIGRVVKGTDFIDIMKSHFSKK